MSSMAPPCWELHVTKACRVVEGAGKMKRSPAKIALRIDWSELDAFGHVNNLAIMKYVQSARIRCLEAVGLHHRYERRAA
jgi:hypothetical protein